MTRENDGSRFDRVPKTDADRVVDDRPTRGEILDYFSDRFGVAPETFQGYTFWEKGTGKIWAVAGTTSSPIDVEALGIHLLRTNQRHWKPTTDAMQRFGSAAERNVIALTREQAARFWRGETQPLDRDVTAGYVIVSHEVADQQVPLGVGLAGRGELRSQVPKGRRRDIPSA